MSTGAPKKGYIYITSRGTDPMAGRHLKDPSLEGNGFFGACQPQIRKQVNEDDFIFVVSGSLERRRNLPQYVVGGLKVGTKMPATEAHRLYPAQRLSQLPSGETTGSIICDAEGNPHPLDKHNNFSKRLANYVVGKEAIVLRTEEEVGRGREETMEVLQTIFHRKGRIPRDVIGRCSRMDEEQIKQLAYWLKSLKAN